MFSLADIIRNIQEDSEPTDGSAEVSWARYQQLDIDSYILTQLVNEVTCKHSLAAVQEVLFNQGLLRITKALSMPWRYDSDGNNSESLTI